MMPACTPPAVIRTVEPAWPKYVHSTHGTDLTASVRISLASDGTVSQASINHTTGIPSFDQSAIKAVEQWQFQRPERECASQAFAADVTFSGVAYLPTPYTPCNHDAFALAAVVPEYPDAARYADRRMVTVKVLDTIAADGSLQSATISDGSGNVALDQASLSAARQSSYVPKYVDCKPVSGGTYLFSVTFDPNS